MIKPDLRDNNYFKNRIMEENDKTCAVCFTRMGDLAVEELKQSEAEPVEQNSGDDWSDMTESIEELYTEQKKL